MPFIKKLALLCTYRFFFTWTVYIYMYSSHLLGLINKILVFFATFTGITVRQI